MYQPGNKSMILSQKRLLQSLMQQHIPLQTHDMERHTSDCEKGIHGLKEEEGKGKIINFLYTSLH